MAERQASLCRVFGNPQRILILRLLAERERTVTEIAKASEQLADLPLGIETIHSQILILSFYPGWENGWYLSDWDVSPHASDAISGALAMAGSLDNGMTWVAFVTHLQGGVFSVVAYVSQMKQAFL